MRIVELAETESLGQCHSRSLLKPAAELSLAQLVEGHRARNRDGSDTGCVNILYISYC
jgi:hypothetical protein